MGSAARRGSSPPRSWRYRAGIGHDPAVIKAMARHAALVDEAVAALQRHLSAATPPLPTSVISDGTAIEQERLGALGDLHLALRRLVL